MKMLFLLGLLFLPFLGISQTFYQPNLSKRFGENSTGFLFMFQLGKGQTVTTSYQSRKWKKIKLPAGLSPNRASFGHIYTQAGKQNNEVLVIQYLLPDSSRLLYVDKNQDYDLRNDGKPYKLNLHPKKDALDFCVVRIKHSKIPKVYVLDCLIPYPRLDSLGIAFQKSAVFEDSKKKSVHPELWLSDKQLDRFEIPYDSSQSIVLLDGNYDGIFGNSPYDNIAFMPKKEIRGDFPLWRSPTRFRNGTRIKTRYGDSWYLIQKLDSLTGRFSLNPCNAPDSGLFLGQSIRNDSLELLLDPAQKKDLKTVFSQSEYSLVDVWGTWCQGCVLLMPHLDTTIRKHQARVQLVGLSTSPSEDSAFMANRPKSGIQLRLNEAMAHYLNVQSFPTLLLFNREGILLAGDGFEALDFVRKLDSR